MDLVSTAAKMVTFTAYICNSTLCDTKKGVLNTENANFRGSLRSPENKEHATLVHSDETCYFLTTGLISAEKKCFPTLISYAHRGGTVLAISIWLERLRHRHENVP